MTGYSPHPESSPYYSYYSDESKRQRRQWKPLGLAAAFNHNLDYTSRMASQRLFYKQVKKAQKLVAKLAGHAVNSDFNTRVKPQLGPCYTTYPAALAAYAAIGQTAYLEFHARVQGNILFARLKEYLANPAAVDNVNVDPLTYSVVAQTVSTWIHARLLLEDLSRLHSLSAVELYRLFCSTQENLKFYSLPEIIRAAILYGDVFPDWNELDLHPMTKSILQDITSISALFFRRLSVLDSSSLLELGCHWVKAVNKTLAKYLPGPRNTEEHSQPSVKGQGPATGTTDKQEQRFSNNAPQAAKPDHIEPLNGPRSPLLQEPATAKDYIRSALKQESATPDASSQKEVADAPGPDPVQETIEKFSNAVESAGNQAKSWEDVRSDIVENSMRSNPFHASPIEGSPVEGSEVTIGLGGKEMVGEIHDGPVDLSDDIIAGEKLREEAHSLTQAFRKNLYPNLQQDVFAEQFTTSGSLDPHRLALADFASTIFRRYRTRELADLRGAPVLAIACDGSGSLNANQMKMLKLLCTSYLESTATSDIKVITGLYTSGRTPRGGGGPIVRWIYHPQKTYAFTRKEAIQAVASLPESGDGVQADALSLAYILESAKKIAMQNMIYLVVISDTKWNRSFNTPQTGQEEVREFFEHSYKELQGKINTTLVALGVSGNTGFEDLLDYVIMVTNQELRDSHAMARKVGMHVAECMRKRNQLMAMHS